MCVFVFPPHVSIFGLFPVNYNIRFLYIYLYAFSGITLKKFSGAWCKRREGVQLPDSLMDEAVLQSVGPGLETPQSPP